MNDLAEKALDGLDVAHRELRGHPMLSLGGAGFLVAVVVVVSGGRATADRADRPLTSWLGLQDVRTSTVTHGPGAVMLLAVLTLAVLWIVALLLVARQHQPVSRVWWVAGAWATPFVLGPPLMDTSVYTYVAYGRLQRAGHNPYRVGPNALGDSPLVAAITPAFRGSASTAGPLGSLLEHLVASATGGASLTAVLAWRAIGLASAVWIARSAAELTTTRGAQAVAACALNPLTLLFVVSSPHLDSVMIALVVTALVAARRRRWWRAVVLAALAGTVLAPGFLALPMIAVVHWFGRQRRSWWPAAVRDTLVAAVTVAIVVVAQPDGLGWLRNVRAQFTPQRTPYSLSGAAEKALSAVVRVASYDDLAAASRLTAAVAALATVVYLVVTARLRGLEPSVGYALLTVALLAPVLNPWYLLWGVLCLLPTASGQLRICLVGISIAACVLDPPGFVGVAGDVVTGVALGALALLTAAALWVARPGSDALSRLAAALRVAAGPVTPDQRPSEISRTAGRTSAR